MFVNKVLLLLLIFTLGCSCKKENELDKAIDENKIVSEEIVESELIDSFPKDYQELDWKPFIKESLIGKEQITGDPEATEYFTNYLGIMQLGKIRYHLVSQFYAVQAAVSKHGHSRIILLDEDIRIRKIYDLSMPDELPDALIDNALVWHINHKIYTLNLGTNIPQMVCIPNDKGCY